jgi:hypothetical protein
MSTNRPDPNSPPPIPRWVKILVGIFIVLIILIIVMHLMGFGMGSHGMGGDALLIAQVLNPL